MKMRSTEMNNIFRNTMEMYGFEVGTGVGQVYADFYSYGGGYVIEMRRNEDYGVSHPFGGTRRSRKEFLAFLEGLRASRHYDAAVKSDADWKARQEARASA